MKTIEIPSPSGFVERVGIRSGRIYRVGLPDYGVVFTASTAPSEQDFDTDQLVGALLENIVASPEEEDRYFEILGGYFYHDNDPNPPSTTRVFGIASEAAFGITEGGATTLDTHWKLDDPEKPFLDEVKTGNGWTFIVVPKTREKFPHSTNPLRIVVACPEITAFAATIGDCEKDPASGVLRRKVHFAVAVGEVEPQIWTLAFGDGISESGEGKPPAELDHLYLERPVTAPQLCLQGQSICGEICQEIDLGVFAAFAPCPRCPEITALDTVYGGCVSDGNVRRRRVTFAAVLIGDPPINWHWDFGDGTEASGTVPAGRDARVDHFYAQKPVTAPKLSIDGPASCGKIARTAEMSGFVECLPCPQVTRLDSEIREKDANTVTAKLTLVTSGNVPELCEWEWGDGSPTETSVATSITHDYRRPATAAKKCTVTVTSSGPEDCRTVTEKTLEIPAQAPPKYSFLLPILVAFWLALAFATLVVYNATRLFQPQLDAGWLLLVISVFLMLAVLAVVLWYRLGKRVHPGWPGPAVGDWLGIGTVVLLAGALTAIYVLGCCGGWWWVVIVSLLALAAVFYFLWTRVNEMFPPGRDILFYALAAMIAAFGVNLLIAGSVLGSCLFG